MIRLRCGWRMLFDLVRSRTDLKPRVGIILGSGLGGFAAEVDRAGSFPYAEIPGFPVSTAIGHKGQLTLGHFAGHPVAVLEGRFHLYEGYSADQVVRPVHLLRALGVEVLIATNAAGGLKPDYRVGDVVVVEDHVNMMWAKPRWGIEQGASSRFYDRELVERALAASRAAGIVPQAGVIRDDRAKLRDASRVPLAAADRRSGRDVDDSGSHHLPVLGDAGSGSFGCQQCLQS